MNILIDAFGGDHAPLEVIKGSIRAVRELGVTMTLVGDETEIRREAEQNRLSLEGIRLLQAPAVFDIHEEPTTILKQHADTSMAVGLNALRSGDGDAFVCAGSTGALVVGATFLVKRIKGIKRAALAPLLPTESGPMMLLDAGANNDCRPEMLMQFALMGSVYMERVMQVKRPRVMLLNVGAEETKGRELELETYPLLEQSLLHFCGNLEARDMPRGIADVAVADGFTGNVALKLYEGMGKFISSQLKDNLLAGVSGKLSAMLILKRLKKFSEMMDYKSVGGAVLLGVQKPVIKAHGSSDATAFFNAIRQAKNCVDGQMIETISKSLSELESVSRKS